MEIVIHDQTKADIFTSLFQHMKLFSEHITLVCNDTRMYMQCMDNAHVSIVELTIPADWFDLYEHTGARDVRMGMNSTFLYRILSSRDKGQKIQLVYSEKDTDRLMIHLVGIDDQEDDNVSKTSSSKTVKKEKHFDKHFELPLIDVEEEMMMIPDIEYVADFAMSSAEFSSIITNLKMFGDTLDVSCCEERIVLASTSKDQGNMCVQIGIDDLTEFAIDEGANLQLSFSLSYLKNMCAYNKISDNVSIKISDSYPMQVAYSLGQTDQAKLVFHLAPKLMNDD